jgi:hypothetical protein
VKRIISWALFVLVIRSRSHIDCIPTSRSPCPSIEELTENPIAGERCMRIHLMMNVSPELLVHFRELMDGLVETLKYQFTASLA